MQSPRVEWRIAKVLLVGALIASVAGGWAAEKQPVAAVEPIYRAQVFADRPSLNPQVTFEFEELALPGLWEGLGVQIFNVWHLAHDNRNPRDPFILSAGKIFPFVGTMGGGFLSGAVRGDALYYSYGYGSGIHRSQLGRLRMKDGRPEQHESKSYSMGDMLVEKTPENRIRIVVRDFPWPGEAPTPLGWIDLQENGRLRVSDDAGGEVVLPLARQPMTREEGMRRRAKMAPQVRTQDAATRQMLEAMGIIIDANNRAYINPAMDDPTKIDQSKAQAAVDAWNLLSRENRPR